jgi:hypothetical protein
MLKDIYPFGMVASLLRQPIGVFYFMQKTYTTKTTIKGQFVEVNIFKNGKFLLMYDFNIKQLEEMLTNHLPEKRWATEENLIEIRDSVLQHLNQN